VSDVVVVDASLAFKWLLWEPQSEEAFTLLSSWDRQGIRPAAPHLLPFEVANALHRRVVRRELTVEAAADLIRGLLTSQVDLHETPDLHGRALDLASALKQGAAYDAHYLALAERLDCELWTADERFFRAASTASSNVRWLNEAAATERA
jgi:predicted nucleic acid-binding protein